MPGSSIRVNIHPLIKKSIYYLIVSYMGKYFFLYADSVDTLSEIYMLGHSSEDSQTRNSSQGI